MYRSKIAEPNPLQGSMMTVLVYIVDIFYRHISPLKAIQLRSDSCRIRIQRLEGSKLNGQLITERMQQTRHKSKVRRFSLKILENENIKSFSLYNPSIKCLTKICYKNSYNIENGGKGQIYHIIDFLPILSEKIRQSLLID